MNFDDAIKAHVSWKIKLTTYLKRPDKSLNAEHVCKDDNCDLGKWIYGEGKIYSNRNEYIHLKKEHARFHKAAAEIIKKADTGHGLSEEVAVGIKSEYNEASNNVVSAIMEMKKAA